MKIQNRLVHEWYQGEALRLPRKAKKFLQGLKMSKSKLRKLLNTVEIGEPIRTMYERREIKPFSFCPKCGFTHYRGGGNMTEYPEHWENFYCIKCNNIVGYIDNSPFIHALECKDNDYNPVF